MANSPYQDLQLPDLDLPAELLSCARQFARSSCVPEGTVLIVLIACLLGLRSHGVTHDWRNGAKRRPHLGILCVGSYHFSKPFWLYQVCGVLSGTVTKPPHSPHQRADDLLADYNRMVDWIRTEPSEAVVKVTPNIQANRAYGHAKFRALHDNLAVRYSEFPPSDSLCNFGYAFSSLIVTENQQITEGLNVDHDLSGWTKLFHASRSPAGMTAPPTVVAHASIQCVRRFRDRPLGVGFPWPLLLPVGGPVVPAENTDADALAQWTAMVKAASDSWSLPPRHLEIDAEGYRTLSEVKEAVEKIPEHRRSPEYLAWVLPLCANIAVWDHLTRGAGNTISAKSWSVASSLTRWAIRAYRVAAREPGRPKHHPPVEIADRERLISKLSKNPDVSYREVVRALPKRPKGYWRKLFVCWRERSWSAATDAAFRSKIMSDPSMWQFQSQFDPTSPTSDSPPMGPNGQHSD